MSNKSKRSKQQKLRVAQKRKQLEIARAMSGDPKMTVDEMVTFKRAINDKETPAEFLVTGYESVKGIINTFDVITRLREDEQTMDLLKTANPTLWENVVKAGDFLADCLRDVTTVYDSNKEAVEAHDPKTDGSDAGIALVAPLIEAYDNVTMNLQENTVNLMAVIDSILNFYVQCEQMVAEND